MVVDSNVVGKPHHGQKQSTLYAQKKKEMNFYLHLFAFLHMLVCFHMKTDWEIYARKKCCEKYIILYYGRKKVFAYK